MSVSVTGVMSVRHEEASAGIWMTGLILSSNETTF